MKSDEHDVLKIAWDYSQVTVRGLMLDSLFDDKETLLQHNEAPTQRSAVGLIDVLQIFISD